MRGLAEPAKRLAWVFPGFGVGGAQVRFCALANFLGPGIAHTLISLNGDVACAEKLAPELDVHFLHAGHNRGSVVSAALHARQTLSDLHPSLVITSNWGAIEWAIGARLAGLRHLHSEDGFGPEERTRQIPRRVFTRRFTLRGSQLILPSRNLKRIAETIWKLPVRQLHYIPNGVDLVRFAHAAPMQVPAGEGPVIGTIAALRPEKNIGRLLRAVAQLRATRPARLVVVGDGPERVALQDQAQALGIDSATLFAGHSTQPERWMASFDAFALPSDTEQMPLSLIEAMAAGLPTACTDVGDVRAMVAPECLPFIAPAEDRAFAAALSALIAADGAAVGGANRARAAAEFGEQAMFTAWTNRLFPLNS